MSTKKHFIVSLIIMMVGAINAQDKRDHQWVIGGSSSGSGILLNFNTSPPTISLEQTNIWMEGANTSISDSAGNLLFSSNGCFIANANQEVMDNGEGINPELIDDFWCPFGGSPIPEGVLALPIPNSDSLYYVFNLNMEIVFQGSDTLTAVAPTILYSNLIDMSKNNGLGKVMLKNQIAIQDTFSRGSLKAVKHANGEDWWLIVPKIHSNCYIISLVNEAGLQEPTLQCTGKIWNDSDGGQATFSPDGTIYARFNYQNGLNIYDFNPETGELSNGITMDFPDDVFPTTTGVSISPNSRYLYASARNSLYQFDLQATDIDASRVLVAEWDGFQNGASTRFHLSALGPDGKIYITSRGSTGNLHVIHKPDCPDLQCEVEQHGVDLPIYNFGSIPNFPHYRNEPTNINCDSIIVSITSIIDQSQIRIFPNPVKDFLNIQLKNSQVSNLKIECYNSVGQVVFNQSINTTNDQLDLGKLMTGVYFYKIYTPSEVLFTGKLFKE